MPQDYFVVLQFDLMTMWLAMGAVIIAMVVSDRGIWAFSSAAAIGAFATLALAAGQPEEPCLLQALFWMAQGAVAAAAFGFLVAAILGIPENTMLFGMFRVIGGALTVALAPRRWSEAAGKPAASGRDLGKRLFVAVSAGAGGIVGGLISLGLFWETLQNDFGVRGLFDTLVLSAVSLTLVGPIHEYVMGGALGTKVREEPEKGGIFGEFSLKSAIRFGIVLFLFFGIDMAQASLAKCVREGNIQAMFMIMLGGITPALVSYYWCAALQLGTGSVLRTASWPSIAGGAVMICGIAATAAIGFSALLGVFDPPQPGAAGGGLVYALGILLAVVGGTVVLSLLFSLFTCGIYAIAGGYAIDRVPGRNGWGALILVLALASLPQQWLGNWIVSTAVQAETSSQPAETPTSATDEKPAAARLQSYGAGFCSPTKKPQEANTTPPQAKEPIVITILDRLNILFGTAGWLLGLYASGFPELLRKKGTAAPATAPLA